MDGEAEILDIDTGGETEVLDTELDTGVGEGGEPEVGDGPLDSEGAEGGERTPTPSKPEDIAKALKSLRSSQDPEIAKLGKLLNDDYFRSQAYQKHGSVQQVAAMAATLARVGGEEGLTKLEGEVNEYSSEMADFASGNARVLDKWIKDAPDGFKKLAPLALSKLFEVDKVAYGRAIAGPLYGTLKNYGLGKLLPELQKSADPAAKAAFDAISQMVGDLEEELRNAPRQADTTEQDKVQTEREGLVTDKFNHQINLAASECSTHRSSQVSKSLAGYLKQKPIGDKAKGRLIANVNSEIDRMLTTDQEYQKRTSSARAAMRQALKAGESTDSQRKALISYVNATMDSLIPKAVKAIWNDVYGGVKAGTRPAAVAQRQAAPADIGKRDYWTLKTDAEREAWRAAKRK